MKGLLIVDRAFLVQNEKSVYFKLLIRKNVKITGLNSLLKLLNSAFEIQTKTL